MFFTGPISERERIFLATVAEPLLAHDGNFGDTDTIATDEIIFGKEKLLLGAMSFARGIKNSCNYTWFPFTTALIDQRVAPAYSVLHERPKSRRAKQRENYFLLGSKVALSIVAISQPDESWAESDPEAIANFAELVMDPANLETALRSADKTKKIIVADFASTWSNAADPDTDPAFTLAIQHGYYASELIGKFAISGPAAA